jgi:transcriptional regulator with XRE-family HTH domain
VGSRDENEALADEVIRLLVVERKKRNLSVYALAAAAGLAPQSIGYIEKGARRPSFDTILRLSEALDVPLEGLLRKARMRI